MEPYKHFLPFVLFVFCMLASGYCGLAPKPSDAEIQVVLAWPEIADEHSMYALRVRKNFFLKYFQPYGGGSMIGETSISILLFMLLFGSTIILHGREVWKTVCFQRYSSSLKMQIS